ncbi:photosynthetic NDH subunit of lumenal location 3, chloroplastic [Impatiens glandulifera]|uniref:photosynthetic NDH subunit of lumenal location 3, chloroplastic n=1 Tax=Impatiens glandulifera TaxID=253017 RepID=UPI001FB19ED4|nr:photosynthetic NDH subunit of lumenal location 3, chloroplastic [Impatiens glandulifera]
MSSFNGIVETLITIPKIFTAERIRNRKSRIVVFNENRGANYEECHDTKSLQASRRMALTLAVAVTLSGGVGTTGISLAKDNGFWIDGPIPIPQIYNKEIANEATGTRSFLKRGIYMANIGVKGSAHRIKKYAFDLLALEDLLGQNAWNYVIKYLRLKSTFLYYDFDKIISAASPSDKQPLIDLANKLFNSVEKLEDAAKEKNVPQTESRYKDTAVILQEVMDRMDQSS